MTFKRAIIWGIAVSIVIGSLTFLVACSAERQSALHLCASALHWPIIALIGWLAQTLHGSADAGLLYMPLVPLYWIVMGFTGGCLLWAATRKSHAKRPAK